MTTALQYLLSQTTGLHSKAVANLSADRDNPRLKRIVNGLATALSGLNEALSASKEG
jgi:hypothetical protein